MQLPVREKRTRLRAWVNRELEPDDIVIGLG